MKGYFIDSDTMDELWERLTKIDLNNANEVIDALGFAKGALYPTKLADYEVKLEGRDEEQQKQADAEIRVGDEVYIISENNKSVVTNIFNASHGPVAMLLSGDAKWIDVGLQYLNKTGKHYPQIAEVLKELRGDAE